MTWRAYGYAQKLGGAGKPASCTSIARHQDTEVKSSKPLVVLDPPELQLSAVQPEIMSIADAERMRFERISRIVIKVTRSDMDVSQRELAKRLSWTRNQVANLETGRRGIGIADFIVIAKALRLDPCRLLNRVLQW
jgi:DNA-binding transcriptional regulator YiaG